MHFNYLGSPFLAIFLIDDFTRSSLLSNCQNCCWIFSILLPSWFKVIQQFKTVINFILLAFSKWNNFFTLLLSVVVHLIFSNTLTTLIPSPFWLLFALWGISFCTGILVLVYHLFFTLKSSNSGFELLLEGEKIIFLISLCTWRLERWSDWSQLRLTMSQRLS